MDFEQVGSLCTGHSVSTENFERTQSRRAEISRASRMMVSRMRDLGVDLIRETQQDAIAIGNLTGCVSEAWPDQDIARKMVVPSHAATERSRWLRETEYYLNQHPNKQNARFAVVTCGPRIEFDPDDPDEFVAKCKRQLATARANMRRWRNESAGYGIEFVLTVLEAAISGNSVHLHFNVIYIPPLLTNDRWQHWLSWSSSRLGAWWRDCGVIRDLREVIKYATKLLGADSLESLDETQFGQMFSLLDGLHTVSAHHEFKQWRSDLDTNGQKVIRLPINGRLVILDKRRREPRPDKKLTPGSEPEVIENRILTRQVPRPFGSEVIEPVTIVQHFTENPTTEAGRNGLAIIRAQQEQAARWAEGNGYIVHTIQPDVQVHGDPSYVSGGGLAPLTPDSGAIAPASARHRTPFAYLTHSNAYLADALS